MVTLASEPAASWTEIVDAPRDPRRASASTPGRCAPTRDSLSVDLGPGLHGAASTRPPRVAAPRVRPARPRADGPVARPVLGAAPARRARDGPLRRALARRRERLRGEELGRRVRRPLVVGPGGVRRGAGVAFAGGRIHGVAPTAVAVWTPDEAGHARARRSRARVARAGGGEWHVRARSPRWRVELERRGRATRSCCPSRSRASAGSRSAPATTCSGRAELRVRRGRRLWFSGESHARRSRTALRRVVHDQQRDVVLAALGAAELAQHVVADRVRREPHVDQRAPQRARARRRSARPRSSISPSV